MKNKGKTVKPYKKLIDRIFLQTIAILGIAIIVVFFLRSAVQGKLGDFLTSVIGFFLRTDWETASHIYYQNIRRYLAFIIVISAIFVFAFFYKMFLNWFTKYFDEMIAGVNGIANREQRIVLSPELKFMEDTMNQIKTDLEKGVQMERELERRKIDLIVYLAHDIKTPLTSVIGYLNLLEETPDMPVEQKSKYVHITLEKAYRLEKLINEFFEIARYNMSTVPLNKEKIDLSYMLVQIVDEAYPQLTAGGKEVELYVPQDVFLYGDSEKMARVFNNLLKNAVAYGAAQSKIHVSAVYENQQVVIRFRNQGMIPQDKLHTIFDKFSRLDGARQSATGGAGLGLAISKDIVTLHGGTISARSQDGYTEITVEIPDAAGRRKPPLFPVK